MMPPAPELVASPAEPTSTQIPRRGFRFSIDRLNPILVRVVRQELRSRGFISIFLLLLAAATVAAAVVAAIAKGADRDSIGPGFFGLIAFVWTFALGVAQPLNCFRAISTERNDDTWDLVELTGMRPISVVGGLMLASLVQGMLYTSALAPFMVMAYLLRGLDLLAIVFALIVVPLGGVAASSLAVFTASLSAHKAVRSTLGGLLGLYLVGMWVSSAGLWFNIDELNYFLGDIRSFNTEAYLGTVWALNAWAAFVFLALVLSSTLLTHRARDRSFAPRLAWWILWGHVWVWPAIVMIFAARHVSTGDFATALSIVACIGQGMAAVYGFFAVSEDHALSPRQARAITHPPRWRKYLTWCLGPGAARGRLGYLAMAWLSLAGGVVAWGLVDFVGGEVHYFNHPISLAVNGAMFGWTAIILVLGDALARGPLRGWFDTAVLRRGFTLLFLAAISLVPPLIAHFCDAEWRNGWAPFISPFTTLTQLGSYGIEDVFSYFLVAAAGYLFAILWLTRQGLRLHITTTRVLARSEDHNPRQG